MFRKEEAAIGEHRLNRRLRNRMCLCANVSCAWKLGCCMYFGTGLIQLVNYGILPMYLAALMGVWLVRSEA